MEYLTWLIVPAAFALFFGPWIYYVARSEFI